MHADVLRGICFLRNQAAWRHTVAGENAGETFSVPSTLIFL
jgi:hypothetical protein